MAPPPCPTSPGSGSGTVYTPAWVSPPTPGVPPVLPTTDVYSWGYNLEGQCGHAGSLMHVKIPRVLECFHRPSPGCPGPGSQSPSPVYVTGVYAGLNYSMAIGRPGGEWGALGGRGSDIPLLLPDRGRYHHSLEGTAHRGTAVYGWGYCDGGWLGLVTPPAASLPYIDADSVSPAGYDFPMAT